MANDNEKQLKADIEDGYTKISNLILEVLAIADLTGVQKSICLFLFRRTYGWDKKEDRISLKEFAHATGSSKSYVSKQLKELINQKVVLRTSHKPGKTPTYTFNTRVEQWHKGCVDTQRLNKNTTQGLYKRTTQGLNKSTTPELPSTPDTMGDERGSKESIKENVKESNNVRNVIDINSQNRDTGNCSNVEKILDYARQKIMTNQLAYESLVNDDLKAHGKKVLIKAIDLAVEQQKEKDNYKRGDPDNGVDIGSWRYIQCFIDQAKEVLEGGEPNGRNSGDNIENDGENRKDEGARLTKKAFEIMGFEEE